MPTYKRLPAIALFVLFALSVALGFVVAKHEYKAIGINGLEYSYFLEFNARVFDPSLAPQLAINSFSGGDNMFFREGPDGAPSMWQWIHFEPIKIVPALLYTLSNSVLASFGFYIVLFFLPLLYGAFVLWKRPEHGGFISIALISLAVYPSSFLYATYTLHPFYVLPSLFICFVLSLLYRRPMAEKVSLLSLFLLVREEALIFVLAALVWESLRNRRDARPQKDIAVLWYVWAGWFAITAVWNLYTLHTGYTFNPPVPSIVLFPVLLLGLCGLLALLWWLWRKGTRMWPLAPDALLGLLALVPMGVPLVTMQQTYVPLRIIYGRFGFTLFYVLIAVLMAYVYEHHRGLQKKIAVSILLVCIVLFIASELIPHASATREYVARWDAEASDDVMVYQLASSIPKDTPLLLDSTTMVAFYAHDNTYAYNYLPYYLYQGHVEEFPADIVQLRTLISSGISYAVLLNSGAGPLLDVITQTGRSATLIEHNAKFSFYRIK